MDLPPRTNELMISVSGIRGVVGQSLTPEITARFAQAFGTVMEGDPILVGRDTRRTGTMLQACVTAGLNATGHQVVDLGVCATPTIQFTVSRGEAGGAVAVTASHNPIEWNALKLIRENGMFLTRELGDQVRERYERGKFCLKSWDEVGAVTACAEATEQHVSAALSLVDADRIRGAKLRIAVDCCNGAATQGALSLLRQLGCDVVPVFCDPAQNFPRNPEPVVENLDELCRVVGQEACDAGIAFDADGDRVALVADGGRALGEEYTLAVVVAHVLSLRQGPVVMNLSTSRMAEDVARQAGCEAHRAPVGDVNVSEKIRATQAVIGGEGNGGVIAPEMQFARDGFAAAALVLEAMASRGESLSAICQSLPRYHMVKRRIFFPRSALPALLEELQSRIDDAAVNDQDGVRFDWEDRWVHVRCSGTEPILRVIGEARDRQKAETMCEQILRRAIEVSDAAGAPVDPEE